MRAQYLFWLFVIPPLVMIAIFLSGPPLAHALERTVQEHGIVFATVLSAGMVIASAGRLLAQRGAVVFRHLAIWLGVFAVAGTSYANRAEISAFYDFARGNIYPSVAVSITQGEAFLTRGWDGHYRATAELNGVPVELLVDTGASMVLLPYEIVASIGINPDALDYSLPVTTANGKSTVAPVRISSIKIGNIAVFDVDAAVAHPGRLKSGLLGMSFLDQLQETTFRGNRLFLKN